MRDMEIELFCWGEVDLMCVGVRVVMTGFPWNEDLVFEDKEVVKVAVAIVAAMLCGEEQKIRGFFLEEKERVSVSVESRIGFINR